MMGNPARTGRGSSKYHFRGIGQRRHAHLTAVGPRPLPELLDNRLDDGMAPSVHPESLARIVRILENDVIRPASPAVGTAIINKYLIDIVPWIYLVG